MTRVIILSCTMLFVSALQSIVVPQVDKRLRVLSYNILADQYLKRSIEAGVYGYPTPKYLRWEERLPKVVECIAAANASVVCLQEVEYKHWRRDLLPTLQEFGAWDGIFSRPLGRCDDLDVGCAIAWRRESGLQVTRRMEQPRFLILEFLLPYDTLMKISDHNGMVCADSLSLAVASVHLSGRAGAAVERLHQVRQVLSVLDDWRKDAKDEHTVTPKRLCSGTNKGNTDSHIQDRKSITKRGRRRRRFLGSSPASATRDSLEEYAAIVCGDFNGDSRSAACQLLAGGQSNPPTKLMDRGYTIRLSKARARSIFVHNWKFENSFDSAKTTNPVTSVRYGMQRHNDHIFFTPYSRLALHSGCTTFAEDNAASPVLSLPDAVHPSDHLPILTEFSVHPTISGYCK